ncbi:hypothetical protein PoB_002876300 [Plakobranchus ocellatus]|uniref:Uncharacterized protein n=1 Tax=Plakobranchus ocellatus TaxID=259542 RepID=A0AAV4A4Y0_9GAST|nr:hypothetical protein PoB_002876300 [Plakobranchus ocellatus]
MLLGTHRAGRQRRCIRTHKNGQCQYHHKEERLPKNLVRLWSQTITRTVDHFSDLVTMRYVRTAQCHNTNQDGQDGQISVIIYRQVEFKALKIFSEPLLTSARSDLKIPHSADCPWTVHNKVISGFQGLRHARAPVAGLKLTTKKSVQISGRIRYPLCHRRGGERGSEKRRKGKEAGLGGGKRRRRKGEEEEEEDNTNKVRTSQVRRHDRHNIEMVMRGSREEGGWRRRVLRQQGQMNKKAVSTEKR